MSTQVKLKCTIDLQSAYDYHVVNNFVSSLQDIKIFDTYERFERCHDAIQDQYEYFFCTNCDRELNRYLICDKCDNDRRRAYDADRAYDEWKDRMLEDEFNE